jgi:hypothetical protein
VGNVRRPLPGRARPGGPRQASEAPDHGLRDSRDTDYARRWRTDDLAAWHELLLDRLVGSEAEDRLERLARHPALGGPGLTFLRARLARQHGDHDKARSLVQACLQELPGSQAFADFAVEVGADLPPRAQYLIDQRP